MRNFYVYEYWRLDNNTCFYIGKGKKNRCFQIGNRNKLFKNILKKTDCAVVIIKENLSEKEAHNMERMLIYKYVFEEGYGITMQKNCISGEPYLVNATWGGEGCSGRVVSIETKKKIKEKHIGKIVSKESKEKNRINHLGKKHTKATKEKIRQASLGRNAGSENWQAKKVICLNTKEIFETIKSASQAFNLKPTNIIYCCKNQINYSGKINGEHLVWMYHDEYVKSSEEYIKQRYLKGLSEKRHQKHKVICINLMKVFNSIEEAKDFLGMKSGSSIGRCCKGQRKTAGKYNGEKLKWMYYSDYKQHLK
ncbi:hypothetical protein LI053_14550 [Clostridium perfringens]|uniref:hypothetical protein n=1 Tax=Clostridium perfringens TaxID=1502 RepID=UPI0022457783|nr:hypothetical protein [Clostridium perfringens]MCX0386659.1 hypothetical protein [Clostridium perfringens]